MMSAYNEDFYSHDKFELLIRAYGLPEVVDELDSLPKREWKLFLESLALTCRDDATLWSGHSHGEEIYEHIDDCDVCFKMGYRRNTQSTTGSGGSAYHIIQQAMIDMGEPSMMAVLSNNICERLGSKISTYGRRLPERDQLIEQYSEKNVGSNSVMYHLRETSCSVRKRREATDWSQLNEMNICDLELYRANRGRFIQGKLIVQPCAPIVGIMFIIEDSRGDVLPVALYNFLSDGLHGKDSNAITSTIFQKGCTIRIAEPLFKIFRDGSRGVRVDCPIEIIVLDDGGAERGEENEEDKEEAIRRAKVSGDVFLSKEQHNSACESYIVGLRKADLVATLLSNRSQAYAKMGDWGRSLSDAAASLTLQPSNKKAWYRYRKASDNLVRTKVAALRISQESDKGGRSRQLLKRILVDKGRPTSEIKVGWIGKSALKLKDKGNNAFKSCDYSKSVGYYTAALCVCGDIVRKLLDNWASCCISIGAYLDSLAASSASLQIKEDGKAVILLARSMMHISETELCQSILKKYDSKFSCDMSFRQGKSELLRCTGELFDFIKVNDYRESRPFDPPSFLPRWTADIEVYDAGSKGRGIRAKSDIRAGFIVLIEPPIVSATSSGNNIVYATDKNETRKTTTEFIVQALITRAKREAVLSNIIDKLYDGNRDVDTNLTLSDFLPNLASNQILLPTHHEYSDRDRVALSAERIRSIITLNSFGSSADAFDLSKKHDSNMYSALSLFNHSPDPSCHYSEVGGCAVVFTDKHVAAGSELTICYHPDEDVLHKLWGF